MPQKQPSVAVTIIMGVILGLVVLAGLFVGWQLLNRTPSVLDVMPEDVRQTALTTLSMMNDTNKKTGGNTVSSIKKVWIAPNPKALDHDEAWCFEIETVSDRGTSSNVLFIAMYQGKWTSLITDPVKMANAGC